MSPHPGAWVTDNIELIAPIAEGAMGKVWVAYHHRLCTRVAVKFVSEKLGEGDTDEALARFQQEASLAAQIKSPHVVQTFDSGLTHQGGPYIVMELLEGQSLGDRIRQRGALPWSECCSVIAQVARALCKAHEQGIVHRDIKPDNIFLCHDPEGFLCKILDFGIAKQTRLPAMGGLTTDGKIVGTPEYMSPELVLEDRAVDYRADLWALAVVSYQMATSVLPFRGNTLGQLCLDLVNRTPEPPSTLVPGLPGGADAWFACALNKDPQQRFASAREMAVAFAAAGDVTVPALASPTLVGMLLPEDTKFSSAADRHSLTGGGGHPIAIGAVAVAVLGLGGAWFGLSSSEPAPARAREGVARHASAMASSALEEYEGSQAKPLDLDEDQSDDGDDPKPPKAGSGHEPGSRPARSRRPEARPPVEGPPAKAEPAKAKPAKPGPTDKRRGKEELGF